MVYDKESTFPEDVMFTSVRLTGTPRELMVLVCWFHNVLGNAFGDVSAFTNKAVKRQNCYDDEKTVDRKFPFGCLVLRLCLQYVNNE